MMVKRVAVLACVACMAVAVRGETVGDAVPRGIVYQGVLKDPQAGPLAGTQSATFRVFADASGGDALWSVQQDIECDAAGLFHAWLAGDDKLLDAFTEPQRLLEVQVDGHGDAIAPRLEFTSVPQTVLARYARQSPLSFAVAGGLAVSNDLAVADAVQFDAGASFGTLEVDGDVAWQDGGAPVEVGGTVTAARFEGDGIAPVGAIVMWMVATNIPAGWALCDGQDGRPNLLNRFPVGVGVDIDGNTYDSASPGGADTVALNTDQIPSHSHSYTMPGTVEFRYTDGFDYTNDRHWWHETPTATTGSAGSGTPHENRPPYLAVCFIVRVE